MDPSLITIASLASSLKIIETFISQYKALQKHTTEFKDEPVTAQVAKDQLLLKKEGQVVEKITTADFLPTDEETKRLITVLENSMNQHFERWTALYAKSGAVEDTEISDKYRAKLLPVAQQMCSDLELLLGYLREIGKPIDDHYKHVHYICAQTKVSDSGQDRRRPMSAKKISIIVALIGLIGLLVPAYWQFVYKRDSDPQKSDYAGRVLDV